MMYPGLSAELRERTGLDNGYCCSGGLLYDHPDEPIDDEAWTAEGIAWERLDETESRAVEPFLAVGSGQSCYLPGMAQVRNPRHLKALQMAAQGRGVALRPGWAVCGWERDPGRITAAVTAAGRVVADQFIVCCGAWSDDLLLPIGLPTGVKPVRGQIVLLQTQAPGPGKILLRGKCYIVPRGDGRVLVGSTEEDVGFDKRTTAAAVAGLLGFAAGLVPALGAAAVERCWAGLRPGSHDGLPTIGRAPGFDNLWVATGHHRAGIQLSPATARVLTEALQGKPTTVPLDSFRPDRAPAPPARVAFPS
jgi:glycine oxidase